MAPSPSTPRRAQAVHETPRAQIGDQGSADGGPHAAPRVAPEERNPTDPATWGRVARNEACPCGSGKKFKHCHGAVEDAA